MLTYNHISGVVRKHNLNLIETMPDVLDVRAKVASAMIQNGIAMITPPGVDHTTLSNDVMTLIAQHFSYRLIQHTKENNNG